VRISDNYVTSRRMEFLSFFRLALRPSVTSNSPMGPMLLQLYKALWRPVLTATRTEPITWAIGTNGVRSTAWDTSASPVARGMTAPSRTGSARA